MLFRDIDECLYRILKDSLVYLDSKNITVDPMTQRTYDYYKKKWERRINMDQAKEMAKIAFEALEDKKVKMYVRLIFQRYLYLQTIL